MSKTKIRLNYSDSNENVNTLISKVVIETLSNKNEEKQPIKISKLSKKYNYDINFDIKQFRELICKTMKQNGIEEFQKKNIKEKDYGFEINIGTNHYGNYDITKIKNELRLMANSYFLNVFNKISALHFCEPTEANGVSNFYATGTIIKKEERNEILDGIIENIEYVEMSDDEYNETHVYDIGVEGNHNFFAENTLVHNCHHLPSNTMNEVATKADNAYFRIGVSATPWRDGGDDLLIEAILSKRKPEHSINASKLIDLGYLVPATIYFVPMKQAFQGKTYHTVYKKAIVENKDRNEAIVKIANKMLVTRSMTTLILIQHVAHGEILQKMLFELIPEESFTMTVANPKTGKEQLVRVRNIEFLSGKDDPIRRKAVIQATKEKRVKILIGSTIADEGLDVPSLDCLILAGGGKSSTRAFQRIGRVLRLFKDPITGEEKKRAICFDFQDFTPMLRRHARVREKLYLTEEKWDIKYFNPALLQD
ncbi:hypothetical protein D3C76_11930 [compost metagenome]